MKTIPQKALPLLFASLTLSTVAIADDAKPGFDARAAVGYQYDSNVSLTELDTNTGQADNATLLALDLDASLPVAKSLDLKLGYGYTQTRHQEFSEFDTAMHRLQAEGIYRIGEFDTGLAIRHFGVRLDDHRFLDISQVSPNVARLFGKSLYVRAAYTDSEKTYADRPQRNASGDAVDLDVYLLLDGMRRFLSFGYTVNSEDATDAELDFDGSRARLAYGHKFDRLQLKARLQYDERDYANVTESIDERRRDTKFRAGMNANFSLTEKFKIETNAQYVDTVSNLDSANFDEVIYDVSLVAEF